MLKTGAPIDRIPIMRYVDSGMPQSLLNQYEFVRRLTSIGEGGQAQTIAQAELTSKSRPLVILGDQGMGKTTLLEWLYSQFEKSFFTKATKLVRRPDVIAEVAHEAVLIVDGLDELAAVGQTNPLHNLLGALPQSRLRNVVISCRTIDWYNERDVEAIRQDAGSPPEVWALEPVSEEQAVDYFNQSDDLQVSAETLIERLKKAGLSSLFSNPLTLRLVRRLASQESFELPLTKADLYAQAVDLLRLDENPAWHGSELNQLSEKAAFSGAGAAMASLLITGADGLTFKAATSSEGGLLRVPDVADLPGGDAVAQIIKSRLFRTSPFDTQCLEPLHRTIAEFMGSTWIANQTKGDAEQRERLISLMKIEGEIPSSLRGLFAWLALHDEWTDEVIQTDPFGLLRYGDPGSLPPRKLAQLFSALAELEALNPNFRGDDRWQRVGPLGLARPENQKVIKRLLASEETGFQVLTIVLEALEDSELVPSLLPELEAVVLDEEKYYRARYEAALLIATQNGQRPLHRKIISELTNRSSHDSNRLAVELIAKLPSGAISTDAVAHAVLAHVGFAPHVSNKGRGSSVGSFWLLRKMLSPSDAANVLDVISSDLDTTRKSDDDDDNWSSWYELSSFAFYLINKALGSIEVEPNRLWKWLSTLGRRSYGNDEDVQSIGEALTANDQLRRGIQRIVLFEQSSGADRGWGSAFYELRNYTSALWPNEADVLSHLRVLREFDELSSIELDAFRFLVGRVFSAHGYPGEVGDIVASIVSKHPQLREIAYPTPNDRHQRLQEQERQWEKEHEQRRLEQLRKFEQHKANFEERVEDLRDGALGWTLPAANAFLGRYSDIDNELRPEERVASWLGEKVASAALKGFEATLHKSDLPSPDSIASTYASGKYWNVIRPILAGIAQRWLIDQGFEGVSTEVLTSAYYGTRGELIENDRFLKGLGAAIAGELSSRTSLEEIEKGWFEPHLKASEKHIVGLFELFSDERSKSFAVKLGLEWLSEFPSMASECTRQILGSILTSEASLESDFPKRIGALAAERHRSLGSDDQQQRLWLAVSFMFDFESFSNFQDAIESADRDFLWDLRFVSGQSRFDESISRFLKPQQTAWIVAKFRGSWPRVDRASGVSSGDRNPWDAADFIQGLINQLANDASDEAAALAKSLLIESDTWTTPLKTAYAQQRRARIEQKYHPPSLSSLASILAHSAPKTPSDLQTAVLGAIDRAARKIRADNTNTRALFFTDSGVPRPENECRDRLLNLLELPYGISATPEELMPKEKRADIGFRLGQMRIPLEVKCQWNRSVWKGVNDQLDQLYAIDHEAYERGIYLVFWFGSNVPSNRKPFPSNASHVVPETPHMFKKLLEDEIPAGRRDEIRLVVLDLTDPHISTD